MRSTESQIRGYRPLLLALCFLWGAGIATSGQTLPKGAAGEVSLLETEPLPLEFIQKSFPDAMVGVPFHSGVQAIGGVGLLNVTVSGDVPPGLTLETEGNTASVKGVPSESGKYQLQIRAADMFGATAKGDFTIQVFSHRPGPEAQGPVIVSDPEVLTVTDADNVFFPVSIVDNENITVSDVETAIARLAQTISFPQPTSPVAYGIAPITLSATGGASGNPVTFSVVSGPGSISGNMLTITGGGTVVVAANQAGNTDYAPAPQVTRNIVVAGVPAALTTPAPGSTLAGSSLSFTWTAGSGATDYELFLGSTGKGSYNLYYSGDKTVTSVEVGGLPTNGETIYARLYTNFNGTLDYYDYTYKAVPQAQATLTSPVPGSALPGTGVTFTWTAATGATDYEFFVGSTGPGSYNLYYSGNTMATSATVDGLPATGQTVYARLYTKFGGVLEYNDYIYAAAPQAPAVLTSPTVGGTLPGTSVTFTWTAATGATDYELFIGSTGPGSYNLFYSGNTTATSLKASGLPTNGETIYVRLYTNFNGTLEYADYTFTTQ
jgi:hypothetical protein